MPPSAPERQRSLGSLLRLPYSALQSRIYGALPAHGYDDLRAAHSAVLRHIDPEGSRITTLAERAGMTKQSMGYLVDSLVGAGYLALGPDPLDGRAKLARLTPRGEGAIEVLLELSAQFERDVAAKLGKTRMAQLRALLEDMARVLEADA